MKLALKIPLYIVGGALMAAVISGGVAVKQSFDSVIDNENQRLLSIAASRAETLDSYLASIERDLHAVASNPYTADALTSFQESWNAIDGDPTAALQRKYIEENPNPTGEKEKLDAAPEGAPYDITHAEYHPWFRSFLQRGGYYDIFLFSPEGNLIYTVFKELDYATNLNSGTYAETDLGNAFRAAMDAEPGGVSFFDFKPYAPSHGAPASFISTPVMKDGEKIGVLVYQMPIDALNAIMQAETGLGESGDAVLIGADALFRTQPRFASEPQILVGKVSEDLIAASMAGEAAIGETAIDGEDRIVATVPVRFNGANLAIAVHDSKSATLAPAWRLTFDLGIGTLAVMVFVAAAGWYGSNSITRPIGLMGDEMMRLAKGDLSIDITGVGRNDELGDMAGAMTEFKANAERAKELEEEQERQKAIAEEERVNAIRRMADTVENESKTAVDEVTGRGARMSEVAEEMRSAASRVGDNATTVASSAEEALLNSEAVAAAAEELAKSIQEIAARVQESTRISNDAMRDAQEVRSVVGTMSDAANQVSQVIGLIRDIAEQTNLLALNATIEAARAGDAGKGFAVVASEVKNLANQTQSSTEEIAQQVTQMTEVTDRAVSSIGRIVDTIGSINEVGTDIAAAVEEQNSATTEIARNVQETTIGTREVTERISEVSSEVARVNDFADQVAGESSLLGEDVKTLGRSLVRIVRTSMPEADRRYEQKPVEVERRNA